MAPPSAAAASHLTQHQGAPNMTFFNSAGQHGPNNYAGGHHQQQQQGATNGNSGRRFKLPRNTHEVVRDVKLTAREFFYLLSGFTLLFLAASLTAQDLSFMVNMVAFIYPAFFSIRALESMRPRELEKWLTYWVVFAFVNIGEMISDNLLWWFPYYWFMKSTFMVWCFLPIENNGSFYVYDNVIRPAYNSNGDEFESMIETVRKNFIKLYNTMKEKTGEFAKRLSRDEASRAAAEANHHRDMPDALLSSAAGSNQQSPAAMLGVAAAGNRDIMAAHSSPAAAKQDSLSPKVTILTTGGHGGTIISASIHTSPTESHLVDQDTSPNSNLATRPAGGGTSASPPLISNNGNCCLQCCQHREVATDAMLMPGAGGPGTHDASSETENRVLYMNDRQQSPSSSMASSRSLGAASLQVTPNNKESSAVLRRRDGFGGGGCGSESTPKYSRHVSSRMVVSSSVMGDEVMIDPVDRVIRDWQESPVHGRLHIRKATSG